MAQEAFLEDDQHSGTKEVPLSKLSKLGANVRTRRLAPGWLLIWNNCPCLISSRHHPLLSGVLLHTKKGSEMMIPVDLHLD